MKTQLGLMALVASLVAGNAQAQIPSAAPSSPAQTAALQQLGEAMQASANAARFDQQYRGKRWEADLHFVGTQPTVDGYQVTFAADPDAMISIACHIMRNDTKSVNVLSSLTGLFDPQASGPDAHLFAHVSGTFAEVNLGSAVLNDCALASADAANKQFVEERARNRAEQERKQQAAAEKAQLAEARRQAQRRQEEERRRAMAEQAYLQGEKQRAIEEARLTIRTNVAACMAKEGVALSSYGDRERLADGQIREGDRHMVQFDLEIGADGKPTSVRLSDQIENHGDRFRDQRSRYAQDVSFRNGVEAARRALMNPRCQPWSLDANYHDAWKTMTYTVSPNHYTILTNGISVSKN